MSFDIQKITKIKKDNILDYIVKSLIKNELVDDYFKYKDNPDNCYYKDFWQFLDITSSDIVNKLYERVDNFINNIKDIDYAEVDSIVNLAKQFNIENNLINFIEKTNFPLEILELINIFSINKSLLLKSDTILTNETLSGLYYNYFYNTTSAFINGLSAISPFVSGFTSGFVDTYIPSIQHINVAIPKEEYIQLIELSGNVNNAAYISNNIYVSNKEYYDFVEYVFKEVLNKFIYLKYRTEELNIPTGLTGYIFEYIYPEILPTINIDAQLSQEEQEIIDLLIKNNITYTFDYKTIADKIELGIDLLENYTLLEQQILNLELAKRNKLITKDSYALNKNKRLREVKVKEYFGFVYNFGIIDYNDFFLKYSDYLDKNKFEYIRNSNQDFISIINDNEVIINNNYIGNTAKFLKNLCIDISKFREYFKNFLKKELLSLSNKGIKVLVKELFDNYIFDLSGKYYSNMNLHPELSGLFNIPKHSKFSIDIIEYYDANEYLNIKSDYIDYENDKRFDLDIYKLREKYFNPEENNYLFTDSDISGFYYNQLNLPISANIPTLSAFQETIFNSSHLSAFITSKANSIQYYNKHYLPIINIFSLDISDKIITGEPSGIFKNNYTPYIINNILVNDDCWYIPPSGKLFGSLINSNQKFTNYITNSGEASGYYIDATQQNIPIITSNSAIEYGNIKKSINYKGNIYDISGIVDNLLIYKYNTTEDNIYNISGSFDGELLLSGDLIDFYYDIVLSGIENFQKKKVELYNRFLHYKLPIIDINLALNSEERDYNNFLTEEEKSQLFTVTSGFSVKSINNTYVSGFPIHFDFYSTYNTNYSDLYTDNNIDIYKRYINAGGFGINNPYNYKNNIHPTIAILPNLKRFIEKIVDDITTVFNDILIYAFDYIINDYNKLDRMLNNYGSFINSWMKDNIDYTFYQTFYEYNMNLDKYDNENKYIDFNGPWNIDALNSYLTDTDNYITKLENNTNKYYQYLKDFKSADAKFNANILKLLKLVDDDTNYNGFGLDTIKQLIDKHIYSFGLDSYRNEWFLYKNKNIFEYPGRLFVRMRSYPLALPAELFINNIDHNSFKNIKYILDFKIYGNTLILITDNPISPKILFCKIAMTRADFKSPKRISLYVEPIHGLEYFDYSQIERLYIGCYIYDNKLFLVDAEADKYNNTLPVNPNNPNEYLLKINNRYYDLVDGTISNEISNITIPVKFNLAYGDLFKTYYILADSDNVGDTVYYQLADDSEFKYYLLNIKGLSENILESASLIKLSKTKGYLSLSYTCDMKFNRFYNYFNVSGDYFNLYHDKKELSKTMQPIQMPVDGLTIIRLYDDEDSGVLSLDSVYYCRPLSNLKHLPILSRPEFDYDNRIADDIDTIKDKLTNGIYIQYFASNYPKEFDIIPFGLVKIDDVIYRIYIDFNKYRSFENYSKIKFYNDNFRCIESDISGSYRFNEDIDTLDSTILIFDDLDSYGRIDSYNNEEKEEKSLNKIDKYIINTVRNGFHVYSK